MFAPAAAAVARQLRITADGRQRVPRQVDFGNDLDAALCRVSDYLADVVLRVVTSVADSALFAAYVFLREEEFRVAFVGRAPQQVQEFLAEEIRPILERYGKELSAPAADSVNV